MKVRLQKVLAEAGICSRRKAEDYIKQGKVSVDGQIVTEFGFKVDLERQTVKFNNQKITNEEKIYVLLHKPTGYVTTLHDPQKRPIVTSLLSGISARLFPVGRLDLDTSGALLMTNDGDFANRILHPSNEINKTYLVLVKGRISREKIKKLEKGIELEGKKTWPAKIDIVKEKSTETQAKITIHEGRKRQVRKMFAAIGHPVVELKRIAYGGLNLGELPEGKFEILSEKELAKIFSAKNKLYKR